MKIIFIDKYTITVYYGIKEGEDMDITGKVKALLTMTGLRNADLMEPLGMKSKQSLSNKFTNNRWSAEDLATVADLTGCELAFILPDGNKIIINSGK